MIAGYTAVSRLDSFAAMPAGISPTMTAVLVFFKRELITLFAADPEVVAIGASYLVIVSSFYVLFSSMFVTGGVIRGAGIWWGIPAGWVVGCSANLVYYLSGRWKRKVVTRPVMGAGPASGAPAS